MTRPADSSGQLRRTGLEAFRGLLESVPDAMVVTDADGVIVAVNTQTERLFGYGRDELIGQPVEILIPIRVHAVHASHLQRYVESPHTRPMASGIDLHARRKDGSECPVDVSLSPLRTEEGAFVCAAIRDLTSSK